MVANDSRSSPTDRSLPSPAQSQTSQAAESGHWLKNINYYDESTSISMFRFSGSIFRTQNEVKGFKPFDLNSFR